MASERTPASLRDHVDLLVGFAFKSSGFLSGPPGVRLARGDNVTEGRFRWGDKTRYWPDVTDELGRYLLRAEDVLVGMDGSNVGRNWTRVREKDLPCLLVQRVACLRARATLDQGFLASLVGSDVFKRYVHAVRTGSSIPHVSGRQIGEFSFELPPLSEQRAIAHILSTLDDKIELNQRVSETLEAMVQAIFKSWFVDFEPVRAKAEGRDPGLPQRLSDLFPDSFEDSELGEIPKGWDVGPLGMLGELAIGGDWGEDEAFAGAVEGNCLRGVDLEHLRQSGHASAPRRWFKPSSLQRRAMDDRDVVVAGSGAGPTGRSLWMCADLLRTLGPCTYSNFCKRIRCGTAAEAVYLDAWLHGMRESGEIWEHVNGTSVPNLDASSLLAGKRIPLPPAPVLDRYHDFVRPIRQKLYAGQNRTLAILRDTLLPKLISGELRISVKELSQSSETD